MRRVTDPTTDMFYYASHVLRDIYPLSREQYRKQSIHRRASYDYLNQIIECAYDCTGRAMRALHLSQMGKTYYERFTNAKTLGLIPEGLADTLIELKILRNKAIHNNKIINDRLVLYDNLIRLVTCGFASFELFRIHEWTVANGIPPDPEINRIVVDKDYVLRLLKPRPMPEHGDEFYQENESKKQMARAKLVAEGSVPRHTIDRKKVWVQYSERAPNNMQQGNEPGRSLVSEE